MTKVVPDAQRAEKDNVSKKKKDVSKKNITHFTHKVDKAKMKRR